MPRKLDRLALVVGLAPLLFTLLTLGTYEWSDNGLFLAAADRVSRGEAPYRDFFWFYLPGAPYLFGALFKIFGRHYWVIRGFFALTTFLTYFLALRVAQKLHGKDGGWGVAGAIALLSWGMWRAILNHNALVPPAGLASILLLLDGKDRRSLLWAGVPAAILIVFNHLAGVLLCAALAASLPIARVAAGEKFDWRRVARESILVWAAPVAMLALVALAGAARGGNAELWNAAVMRPLLRYLPHETKHGGLFELRSSLEGLDQNALVGGRLAHAIRMARLLIWALAVRIVPFAALGVMLFVVLRRRADPDRLRAFAITLTVGGFLFLEAFKGWRADRANLAALPLLLGLWSAVALARPRWRALLYTVGTGLALCSTSFSLGTVGYILRTWKTMPLVDTELGPLRSTTVEEAQTAKTLVDALRARHKKTLFAYYYDPSLYPLTGLQPTTRYEFFTTILFTESQLEEVCADLRRSPADLVVRDPDWDLRGEKLPDTLDRCVRELYVEDERIESGLAGHPLILMRRR